MRNSDRTPNNYGGTPGQRAAAIAWARSKGCNCDVWVEIDETEGRRRYFHDDTCPMRHAPTTHLIVDEYTGETAEIDLAKLDVVAKIALDTGAVVVAHPVIAYPPGHDLGAVADELVTIPWQPTGRTGQCTIALLVGMPASLRAELERRERSLISAGRNAPCPCGSSRKFKQCHGRPS